MAKVIALKDGRCETLFSNRDFEYVIEKYMGYESVQFFREALAEKDEELKEQWFEYEEKLNALRKKVADLEAELEEKAHDKQ